MSSAAPTEDCPVFGRCAQCILRKTGDDEDSILEAIAEEGCQEPLLGWRPATPATGSTTSGLTPDSSSAPSSEDQLRRRRPPTLLAFDQRMKYLPSAEKLRAQAPVCRPGVREFEIRGGPAGGEERTPRADLRRAMDVAAAHQPSTLPKLTPSSLFLASCSGEGRGGEGPHASCHDLMTPISAETVLSPGFCMTKQSSTTLTTSGECSAEQRCRDRVALMTPMSLDTEQGDLHTSFTEWVQLFTPSSVRTCRADEMSEASGSQTPTMTPPKSSRSFVDTRQPHIARLFD